MRQVQHGYSGMVRCLVGWGRTVRSLLRWKPRALAVSINSISSLSHDAIRTVL